MHDQQSIIVHFKGWIDSLEPIHRLTEQLREVLDNNPLGLLDGHEIAMDCSHGYIFFYGPDAQLLFEEIKSILIKADLLKCTKAVLHQGTTTEIIISL
ncbi:hypothetical protein SAMN05421640_3345 [Ekhidna lutea]|uniref:Uncharacterized protein n=1 Tax=Ekhidna lutea TaxID=447679 RepID=A0A239LL43_EKHLU|nr:hypothetical protein [Ekhidna lutea]SNT31030.1 hypothetical protein SAMN05421640_3345 [Ekhidna lutea]